MGYRDGSISMLKQSLPSLLSSLRLNPNLPLRSWYLIAGATLSTLNRPDAIAHVFQYAIEKDKDTGTNESETSIARRMREALVKTAPIAGLPKVSQWSEGHRCALLNKVFSFKTERTFSPSMRSWHLRRLHQRACLTIHWSTRQPNAPSICTMFQLLRCSNAVNTSSTGSMVKFPTV